MSLPMWMPWRPLVALGEAIAHVATVGAWIAGAAGLLVLCIHLCVHLLGQTRLTAFRGWVTWRWHRRAVRRFAHAVARGDPGSAEAHARRVLASVHGRRATRLVRDADGRTRDR